jgi:hypothetical protein
MFHHVFYSVLVTAFNLAFAILPAAPLFALKKHPSFAVRNSLGAYSPGSKNGAPQKRSR